MKLLIILSITLLSLSSFAETKSLSNDPEARAKSKTEIYLLVDTTFDQFTTLSSDARKDCAKEGLQLSVTEPHVIKIGHFVTTTLFYKCE